MARALVLKLLVIAGLALTLAVPLALIAGKVREREAHQRDVQRDIAASTAQAQRITGPIVAYECEHYVFEWVIPAGGRKEDARRERVLRPCAPLFVLPERLAIDGRFATQVRHRGIYAARVYQGTLLITGEVQIPELAATAGPDARRYLRPTLAMSITDPRGLKGLPALTWRGTARSTEPGVGASGMGNGIHLALEPAARPGTAPFALSIELQGTERLDIAPLGRETEVRLASDWPHPSFVGRYLPDQREIGDAGFRATWRTTHFATGAPAEWHKLLADPGQHGANTLGVAFIEPVDFYTLSYRAAEYGFLLVVLTFGMFFLVETLKGVRIHPVQYALIGLALAVFFLLLLALGEHLGFTAAYALAAIACTLLLAFYSRYVFGSWRGALRYTAWNAGLYGALYVVLGSEDYALALGATLVFLAIAAGMVASRGFDWYSLTARRGTAAHRSPPPVPG